MSSIKEIANNIARIITESGSRLIAIDGRCASGKTALSAELQNRLDCNVIHMDHFFLRPEQRIPERLNTPGENVDHERFLAEVLTPIKNRTTAVYRPFDCKTMSFGKDIELDTEKITIIEGSYSCHNFLYDYYDLHIFLDVPAEEQMKRIKLRNGDEKAEIFKSKWIPLEESYFNTFGISEKCEYNFRT